MFIFASRCDERRKIFETLSSLHFTQDPRLAHTHLFLFLSELFYLFRDKQLSFTAAARRRSDSRLPSPRVDMLSSFCSVFLAAL